MPRAKPAYDKDGTWKYRQFQPEAWARIENRVRERLVPLFPVDKSSSVSDVECSATAWSNTLLNEAHDAISTVHWHSKRRTNEELRAERMHLLGILGAAEASLNSISHDLDIMLGVSADVLGARDKILALMPLVEATGHQIDSLPRAKKTTEANSAAALEMAVRCLRVVESQGGQIKVTADVDRGYISTAVQILKVLGDELGLPMSATSWKRFASKAKAYL